MSLKYFPPSVHAELILKRLTEGESLGLSCVPQRDRGPLMGLHLYHRGPQSQTTLLSISAGGEVRTDPERRARLQLSGGLSSLKINASISGLQLSDSGLYMWELSYRDQDSEDQLVRSAPAVFLLVDVAGAHTLRKKST